MSVAWSSIFYVFPPRVPLLGCWVQVRSGGSLSALLKGTVRFLLTEEGQKRKSPSSWSWCRGRPGPITADQVCGRLKLLQGCPVHPALRSTKFTLLRFPSLTLALLTYVSANKFLVVGFTSQDILVEGVKCSSGFPQRQGTLLSRKTVPYPVMPLHPGKPPKP